MSLKIKDRAKPAVPPVEPGVYMAACVGVIDLGEQYSEKYKNYSNKVMLTFELLGQTVEIDGEQKPRQVSKIFAFATGQRSGLRKFLQSWDGKQLSDEQAAEEDLSQRLGRTCQLQVVLNETGDKANIDNIMALPKGIKLDKPQSELVLFDLDEFDQATFDKLSDWTRETIQKSTQWAKNHADTSEIKVNPETGEVVSQANPAGGTAGDGGTDSSASVGMTTGDGGVPF